MAAKDSISDHPEFDWGRAAQLKAINRLELPAHLVGLGRPVSAATLIGVLRVIDDHQREHAQAWPSLMTIADCARVSKKTVQRVIDCLENLGLLTVWEERTERGHPRLTMAINWSAVFAERLPAEAPADNLRRRRRERVRGECERLPVPPATQPESECERLPVSIQEGPDEDHERPPDPTEASFGTAVERLPTANPGDTGSNPGDTGSNPGDTGSTALYMNRERNRPCEPSSPSPQNSTPRCRGSTWSEVEEELTRCGVNSLACVEQARRNVTAAHVLELIRWWQERRETWVPDHQPGVLFVRIQRARAYLAVEDGWRDPHPERLARWKRQQQTPPAIVVDRAERTSAKCNLESIHGAELDALAIDELEHLASELSPFLQSAVRRMGRHAKAVRGPLLVELSKQAQGVPP